MSILSKADHRFNATPIKIPTVYFTKIEKPILKFTWNHKGTWIAKTILKKKKKAEGVTHPDFKTYYKATVIKQYGTDTKTNIHTNEAEQRAQKKTHAYTVNGFSAKRPRIANGEKYNLFNKWCYKKWISSYKIMKLYPYLTWPKGQLKMNISWIYCKPYIL